MKWVFFIFKDNLFTLNDFDTLSSSLFNILINFYGKQICWCHLQTKHNLLMMYGVSTIS